MKENIFTAIDKKNIYGRIKNIYVKKNDNSKVKYIKHKGEYVVYLDKKDYYLIHITNIHKYKNNKKIFNNKHAYNAAKIKLEKNPNMTIVILKKEEKKVYSKTPAPYKAFI